jgi:hypothetical protein
MVEKTGKQDAGCTDAAFSVEEHRSASKSVCADAAKHRPIGKAMGGCEGLNENGEML